MFFEKILILLAICGLELTQGQQYILDPRLHFPVQETYHNRNKPIEYQQNFPGFSSFNSFLPERDLETSDVPVHLQEILPQYGFQSKEQLAKNTAPYHNSILFRPDLDRVQQSLAPSTHRPNYAHFFAKNNHAFNPRTETFLGEAILDSPSVSGKPIPSELLRQHTRILAPDPKNKQNHLKENKYFVNENGEVIAPTIISPKRLSTKLEVEEETPNNQKDPRNSINDYDKTSYTSLAKDHGFNSANNFDSTDYDLEDDTERFVTPKSVRSTTSHVVESKQVSDDSVKKEEKKDENRSILSDQINNNYDTKITDPVVSVVTTKSVINNTIIGTNKSPINVDTTTTSYIDNSTDSWVVVASVQTSKSISGAHYLPSSIVAQEERFALLNENSHEDNLSEETSTEDYSSYEEYDSDNTTEEVITLPPVKHSTESLIDKLDRVQSDLSSGLLTGGYKNEDNNIAVITENMTDKIHVVEVTESPTETSQLFPSVAKNNFPIIKKFTSRSRPPASSLYPKRKPQIHKKPSSTPKSSSIKNEGTTKSEPTIVIADPDAYLPPGYKVPSEKKSNSDLVAELLKTFKESKNNGIENDGMTASKSVNDSSAEAPSHRFGSSHKIPTEIQSTTEFSIIESLLKGAKPVDIKNFLPPGYKPQPQKNSSPIHSTESKNRVNSTKSISPLDVKLEDKIEKYEVASVPTDIESATKKDVLSGAKQTNNSANSPSGNKQGKKPIKIDDLLQSVKDDDISAFLPVGYKTKGTSTTPKINIEDIFENSKEDDISAFLPVGYKTKGTSTTPKINIEGIFENSKKDDISAFLPVGYKTKGTSTTPRNKIEDIIENSKKDDISAFLPPGFKPRFTTRKPIIKSIESEDLPTSLLPSGYKPRKINVPESDKIMSSTEQYTMPPVSTTKESTTTKGSLKVVFPSRPGGKRNNHKITTARPREERKEVSRTTVLTIHKGWPTRATTEFTGWPTPSTTPISIEKLLESVQRVSPTSAEPQNVTVTTSTQAIITSTTTTQKPTTPGVCAEECDLVGTIKLVDGVKWVPELLDRNTKEWQILANEVQTQLEEVYSKTESLRRYFKNLRIDGFSQGSVLVDYLIEMQNTDMYLSTSKMKKLFNEALESTASKPTPREGKALNETAKYEMKSKLGKFIINPMYTDFIVVPKQRAPAIGYIEDDLLLPQWAIAVIVIGLASLLFVIIFGVTVLVNRSKNAKKKAPTPLSDDMLNELSKDHMGGYDNYGIEDPYSVEAGFWDPRRIDTHREYNKLPKKGSSGSIHDNSMTNLYDSWNSQNNGIYNNSAGSYYGHQTGPGSSHKLYERRRSYDTNF